LQSRIKKTAQFNSVLNTLKQALGAKQHLAIAQLARHICKEQTSKSFEETIDTLLSSGYSVAQLLSGLLQCESLRMKMLFPGHSSLPLTVQFDELRRTVYEFNNMQDMVMAVGERFLSSVQARNIRGARQLPGIEEERLVEQPELSAEEKESLRKSTLETAIAAWTKSRQVHLFNPFRGLHVTASATLLGKGKDKLSIQLDRDVAKVFASHSEGNRAFVLTPDSEMQIHISLLRIEAGKLLLELGEIAPSFFDKRQDLGVQVADQIPVRISNLKRLSCQALLFDLSVSGLGLIVGENETCPLEQGDEVQCEFRINNKTIRCEGWARWIQGVGELTRIGIELKNDAALQQTLQKETFRLQRMIIAAIHEIEVPAEMLTALV